MWLLIHADKWVSKLWWGHHDNDNDCAENFLPPGGRLNKKDGLTKYGDSHVKDKTS